MLGAAGAVNLDAGLPLLLRAGRGLHHVGEVTRLGQPLDLFRGDRGDGRVLLDVDDRRLRRYRDAFGQRRDREREIDLQQLTNPQAHIRDLRHREPLQRGGDLVDAGRQRRETVGTLVIGHRGLHADERRARRLDRCARQDGAR